MKQVVFDTCVLVAGLKSNRGASFQLLKLIGLDHFQINLSVPLVLEYEDVLTRGFLTPPFTSNELIDIVNYLVSVGNIHEVFFLWRPILKDPKDDMVLELAVRSNSSHIITFNEKDFKAAKGFGIQIKTPGQFLKEIGVTK